jgi:hypothetical protein
MKPRQHQGLEPDGVNGHHQVLVVAPAEDLTAGDLAADGKQATQGDAAAPAKPTALVAPTLLQPLSGPDKGSQQQQQAAQQQPLGPLLASPHFWAPAVAGAVAFCNMAAVMVGGACLRLAPACDPSRGYNVQMYPAAQCTNLLAISSLIPLFCFTSCRWPAPS